MDGAPQGNEVKKLLTLVFCLENNQILLGYKKKGFGAGRWNGFGGKQEAGETLEEAAKREIWEECGVKVTTLEKRAVHQFSFYNNADVLEVHTFLTTSWEGIPQESEEMKPEWFPLDKIPYESMWPDDILWLPRFLKGEYLVTRFHFGEGDQVLEHEVMNVSREDL